MGIRENGKMGIREKGNKGKIGKLGNKNNPFDN
jgi:hypothetical protein